MEKKRFCHLHLHTEYSLLDSSAKIKKVISRAKELGMESIAITDHGVMYGCVAFYKEAIAQGIKPIFGCEIYVAGKSMNIKINDKDNGTYHLVLLVKNEVGYENLMKIVSAASIIAKVERDKQLEIIRQEYGSVGSGYPSDKNTINYLKTIKNNQFPPIIRKTWKTIENITKSTE